MDQSLENLESNGKLIFPPFILIVADFFLASGVQYHVNDTICFSRNDDDKSKDAKAQSPLYLGRIIQFYKSNLTDFDLLKIELILRNDQIFDSEYKDSRRVILTKVIDNIKTTQIVSHIQVLSFLKESPSRNR